MSEKIISRPNILLLISTASHRWLLKFIQWIMESQKRWLEHLLEVSSPSLPLAAGLLLKVKHVNHRIVYWALKTVKGGESSASLGALFQYCTVLLLVKLLLRSSLNFPRCNMSLFLRHLPLWRRVCLSHLCSSLLSNSMLLLGSLLVSQAKQASFPDLPLYNLQSWPLTNLVSLLLASLQFCSIPFELGVPRQVTVYQVRPDQCWVGRGIITSLCFPSSSSCSRVWGLLYTVIQHGVCCGTQVVFNRAASQTLGSQPALTWRTILPQFSLNLVGFPNPQLSQHPSGLKVYCS